VKLPTVTELTSSTDYTFTVKATGIDGDLSAADAVTVTTKTSAPTNLQASAHHHQQF
jgi:chitodextrinase